MNATPETRRRNIVEANITATHAYQLQLHRKTGRGDPIAWASNGTADAELARLVAHQQALLALPAETIRQWTDSEAGAFKPADDLLPLLAAPLPPDDASLPVNVIADYLGRQPQVTMLKARALASLFQMMFDTERDGDRLQELFALYMKLGLPIHTAQAGLLARTDDDFMDIARRLVPSLCRAPFDTDEPTVRMQFRKMWNWGHRHTGERDRRTVALELLQGPDVQALMPRVRLLPAQKIAVIGHSFTMEVNWQAPSAFVPIAREMLATVNADVEIRQWASGGLSLSRLVAETYYQEALAWKPDRVLFVVAFYKDEDYAALGRMTAGFRAAGVREVAIFDHLRATRHNTVYEESESAMRAVSQRTGLTIVETRRVLNAAPDADQFPTLDGIHMAEPYHRLMAVHWLRFLASLEWKRRGGEDHFVPPVVSSSIQPG